MARLEFRVRGDCRRAFERRPPRQPERASYARVQSWFAARFSSAAAPLWIAAFTVLPLYGLAYVGGASDAGVLACKGRIFPRPTSGYHGDPVRITIQFRPPTQRNVTRVTMSQVTCEGPACEAERRGPRHFVWEGIYQAEGNPEPGWVPARFDAYDEQGRVLCSGTTRGFVLGTRPD